MAKKRNRWICRVDRTGRICRDIENSDPNVRVGLTGVGYVQLAGYTCKTSGKGSICFPEKKR